MQVAQQEQNQQPVWIVFEDDRPLVMCLSSAAVQRHVGESPNTRRGVLYAPAGMGDRFPAESL